MIDDIYTDVAKLPHSNNPAVITCDEIPAFVFFSGFLIWVDLQCSISIGQAPRLSELHDRVLNDFPTLFRLQHIIGCESWVLQIISRIAILHQRKNSQGGKFNITEFRRMSEQIRNDLDQRLEGTQKGLQDQSYLPGRSHLETTRIFALAAMTYLLITISGPPADPSGIQASVYRTIRALKQLRDINLLKALQWPLYLTGCMAIGKDREYILSLFTTLHNLYSGACTLDKYSQMLKHYWAARETNPDCDIWESDSGRPLFI